MMNSVTECLDLILCHLQRLGRPVVDLLRPGIDATQVWLRTKDFGLRLPDQVIEIYGWRNGTRTREGDILDDLHCFPGFYFLSLDEALEAYAHFRTEPSLQPWFPLFANGGGDFYAVNCTRGELEEGEIGWFLLWHPYERAVYEDLLNMLRTIAKCFEEGIFFVSKDGRLDAEDSRHIDVARTFNSRLSFYSRV